MTGDNHIIDNPVGVDKPIQKIQNYIFENLDWKDCDVYGRVYKLNSKKGILPRAFVSGKDYKDVFTDDKKTASVFFICEDQHSTKEGILFNVKTKIVFMVNIKKILENTDKRADADIHSEVINTVLNQNLFTFNRELETGIDEVFKGFDTSSIKNTDLHPFHVFSINGEINYSVSEINCFK